MSRGLETREKILDRAFLLASKDGLEGLTIGTLADTLGMSKSGLFSHFGSKEDLQVEVLKLAAQRFENVVFVPALKFPRGEPRLKQILENWLAWSRGSAGAPGGCIFIAAAAQLDDKEGRARDFLVGTKVRLITSLTRAVQLAVECGHFRADVDCEQFAFEAHAIALGYHHSRRLLRDPKAEARARASMSKLIVSSRRPV